jgi:hypothetical protein
MREESVRELLAKAKSDWDVIDKLMYQKKLKDVE